MSIFKNKKYKLLTVYCSAYCITFNLFLIKLHINEIIGNNLLLLQCNNQGPNPCTENLRLI